MIALPSRPHDSKTVPVPISGNSLDDASPCLCYRSLHVFFHPLTSSISFIHRSIPSKDQRLVMSYTKRIPCGRQSEAIRKFHSRQCERGRTPVKDPHMQKPRSKGTEHCSSCTTGMLMGQTLRQQGCANTFPGH